MDSKKRITRSEAAMNAVLGRKIIPASEKPIDIPVMPWATISKVLAVIALILVILPATVDYLGKGYDFVKLSWAYSSYETAFDERVNRSEAIRDEIGDDDFRMHFLRATGANVPLTKEEMGQVEVIQQATEQERNTLTEIEAIYQQYHQEKAENEERLAEFQIANWIAAQKARQRAEGSENYVVIADERIKKLEAEMKPETIERAVARWAEQNQKQP